MAKQKKYTFTLEDVRKLKKGDKLAYVFFNNICFDHITENEQDVVMIDMDGNEEKVPMWMFLKYAEPARVLK